MKYWELLGFKEDFTGRLVSVFSVKFVGFDENFTRESFDVGI